RGERGVRARQCRLTRSVRRHTEPAQRRLCNTGADLAQGNGTECDRGIQTHRHRARTIVGRVREVGENMAPFKKVVTTQADWQQGTLDGVVATAAGDLELAAEFSDDFDRSTLGPDWEIAPGTQGSVQLQNGELVLTGGSTRRMWVRTTRTF